MLCALVLPSHTSTSWKRSLSSSPPLCKNRPCRSRALHAECSHGEFDIRASGTPREEPSPCTLLRRSSVVAPAPASFCALCFVLPDVERLFPRHFFLLRLVKAGAAPVVARKRRTWPPLPLMPTSIMYVCNVCRHLQIHAQSFRLLPCVHLRMQMNEC